MITEWPFKRCLTGVDHTFQDDFGACGHAQVAADAFDGLRLGAT